VILFKEIGYQIQEYLSRAMGRKNNNAYETRKIAKILQESKYPHKDEFIDLDLHLFNYPEA